MRGRAGILTVLRGALSRAGTSAMILVVSVTSVAAATAGPTYFAGSKVSILRDTVSSGPVVSRGYEATQAGSVDDLMGQLQPVVTTAVSRVSDLFDPPVQVVEATAFDPRTRQTMGMVWRSGVCAHLHVVGSCPTAASQVVVSQSMSSLEHWQVGQRVTLPTWGDLQITGVYSVPDTSGDYWFGRGNGYFPYETPRQPHDPLPPTTLDALFTDQSTIVQAPPAVQGTAVIDDVLAVDRLVSSELTPVDNAITNLQSAASLGPAQVIVQTSIPATMSTVRSGWSSLAIPVLIITLQIWALSWLLLLLLVSEEAAAKGAEVALAKLRGYGPRLTTSFALAEPLVILAVALPVGAAAGWWATDLLARARLRPGVPIGLPSLGWAAAAIATAGGLAAVAIASRRTLRTPVVHQWRLATRRGADRSWIVDAMLLTSAAAGLLELELSGTVSAAARSPLSLLVPGLLGVTVAVVGSRLLPLLCRAATEGRHRRVIGLGGFVALRQIGRRPGGTRTTIMLGAAFALAAFGVAAFEVDQTNYRTEADAAIGAPTVLTVAVPQNLQLGAAVRAADPSGNLATPVEYYAGGGPVTLAVDPAQWSRIASWPRGTTKAAISRLPAVLDPPEPPPLVIGGDQIRVEAVSGPDTPSGLTLSVDVDTSDGTAPTPVYLGTLPATGRSLMVGSLVSCPCQVRDLSLLPRIVAGGTTQSATVDIQSIAVHDAGGWHTLDAGLTEPGRWAVNGGASGSGGQARPGPDGLSWTARLPQAPAMLNLVDAPSILPAVTSQSVTRNQGALDISGLDGQPLTVRVAGSLPAVPSAPAGAILVDRQYAENAASGDVSSATQQIWIASGAAPGIERRLQAEGIHIVSSASTSAQVRTYEREGPGLARILFLAEAAVAAALAAVGSVLGLYLLVRRRRFELAALLATGLSRRSVLAAVAIEQLVVAAFGSLVGVGAGILAAVVVLRRVPEFQSAIPGVDLAGFPATGSIAAALGGAVAIVIVAALAASVRLARGVRLDQLRETPT